MTVRKIFVDSRFRNAGNFANFQYSLKAPVKVAKCRAFIDSIHIPQVFPTIHENNQNIYLEESWNAGANLNQRKVALTIGNYTADELKTELLTRLNANTGFPNNTYTVTYSENTGKLTIGIAGAGNGDTNIWSMEYLKAHPQLWTDPNSTFTPDDDCYSVIGFTDTEVMNISIALTGNAHISVLPFHTIYLTCSYGLGSNDECVGPRGNSNILRTIPITSSFGTMIHDTLMNAFEFTTVQAGQLTSFGFALTDIHGRDVPLEQGFSFSILLVDDEW